MFRRSLRNFLTLVVLPLALAGGGTVWLTADLLSRLSTGANIEDHKRTAEVVASALESGKQQLANVVSDNANWDDAAIAAYAPTIDDGFFASAWGDPSETGINYDGAMIVDGRGTNVAAYLRGEPFKGAAQAFFKSHLELLLATLPHNQKEFKSAADIIETSEGLAFVAAGNVVPTTPDLVPDSTEPRYLVFWKFLTPDHVSSIGNKFVIKGLTLTPAAKAGPDDFAVTSRNGESLGALHWQDRRPGDLTRANIVPKATGMLALLIAAMTAIALFSWRLFRQISEREEKAKRDAREDTLTGLPNRHALMTDLGTLIGSGGTVAVTFVDLDGFKDVNDTYDHETGDRLLMAVAAGLQVLSPEAHLISRIGGDEFVIVHEGKYAATAAATAAPRIIGFLKDPIEVSGRLARVGASIGIAVADDSTMTPGELMRRADVAMYAAKGAGKNRARLFTADLDNARDEAASIVNELRTILAEGRLDVVFQPIIDAATLRISAVEALARWPKSAAMAIGPDRFIPLAETSGLIDALGDQILAKACAAAAQWPELRVSVNVSPVQLHNPSFAARTLAIIDHSGIARRRIELEVTEGTMISDMRNLKGIFETLHAAGVTIALDDFGSGYSSIAYLREFAFDRIKIDRSLTQAILTDGAARNMIQATGLIASGVKAAVTAEGVESAEELQLLRLAGCSEYQGFYFGKPQSAAEITLSLARPIAA